MEMSTSTEPGFILRTISRVTSLGAAAPGTSTAPTTRSAASTSLDVVERRKQRVQLRADLHVELVEPAQRFVDHRHISLEPHGHARGIGAGDATAENHHFRSGYPGHATQQHAHAALLFF